MNRAGNEKLPEWSDSLFASVYQWVKQGTPPPQKEADASIVRYSADHRLYALAVCMRSLVMEGDITPDWYIEQGYHSSKDSKQAEEKRTELILKHISRDELTSVLGDIKRINWLWSGPKNKERKEATNLNKAKNGKSNLTQLADSEKARLLAKQYEGIAIHPDSEVFYTYQGGVWVNTSPLELTREMGRVYDQHETNFSKRNLNNVVDALKMVIPVTGEPCQSLIPFSNGVFDIKTKVFSPHSPSNWLLNHNGIEYTLERAGENLKDDAPNFHQWLDHAANADPHKMKRIFAALYMVLANRYDWQLFLEITGEGGSGKSVFTQVATLLAGQHNTASGNMTALDTARGRAQFVGKSMITLPDQPKYTGEGTGIKAITGGDAIEIDPKHEKQYTDIIRAVVIATNNTPMIFTERAGGVARRRVIFQFNNKVKEEDKDPLLAKKIEGEIPVIVRRLLATFDDPEDAKTSLIEQRDSMEALEVKRETDPLIDFCAYLVALERADGMFMGNATMLPFAPRKLLYHAYIAYMQGNGNKNLLTLTKFGRDINGALRELGKKYIKDRVRLGVRTNLKVNEMEAEDWLP